MPVARECITEIVYILRSCIKISIKPLLLLQDADVRLSRIILVPVQACIKFAEHAELGAPDYLGRVKALDRNPVVLVCEKQ